ncbi:hypothetical protein UFOVP1640_70 [uncultured Caudovirales phage]|jgi:hypothetical protein|uniref:Uncharacterized protein n=1 Tax=uncultured Caudovirales phage TaxID=2100421 RepID=A0A6J5T291_9CAUD|nr:hypothetical protein UFOVP1286_73 [uncultured Caudovirales phage]CAB4205514.1 hypothetical protein UFOVP1407_10 [uncultured Caudovirales phage]CAB4221669.1 hypothetical protein UFOVP1640_70 [uncultured Caudovirales phage]
MRHIITHKVRCSNPRLSDEEVDPLELDDIQTPTSTVSNDGWLPWTNDDIMDIKKIINKLPEKQRVVIEAFLAGQNNKDIRVSEKFFRYHLAKAIYIIKQELNI